MADFLDPEAEIAKHGGKLPHWQQGEVIQFVTFRLGDAMPEGKMRRWREERAIWMKLNPEPWGRKTEREYHQRFSRMLEEWLDAGSGSCLFRESEERRILEATLMRDQGDRVEHHAWVIMPNHVHLLFAAKLEIGKLIKVWKGVSARGIGKGSIWQRNYRDTLIRDSEHFANAVRYIRRNPARLSPGTFTLWEGERALAVP